MGLDMYLHAKKYVEKTDWNKVRDLDIDMDSDEAIYPKFKDLMDLAELNDVAIDIYGAQVEVTCAYWRKSNQIHKWFVDNVQGGKDDCDSYYVSLDKLKELREVCRRTLFEKNPNLLPPQAGFFFGSYDIDEWYWEDIKRTIKKIDRILALPNLSELSFSYQSSW